MTEISMTKMSSKGQIVIPREMRTGFKEGEKFIIVRIGEEIILINEKYFDEKLKDDLIFAKRTEEAYKKYERGEFKTVSGEKFLELLDEWSK